MVDVPAALILLEASGRATTTVPVEQAGADEAGSCTMVHGAAGAAPAAGAPPAKPRVSVAASAIENRRLMILPAPARTPSAPIRRGTRRDPPRTRRTWPRRRRERGMESGP